jgi:hypothetical protein
VSAFPISTHGNQSTNQIFCDQRCGAQSQYSPLDDTRKFMARLLAVILESSSTFAWSAHGGNMNVNLKLSSLFKDYYSPGI